MARAGPHSGGRSGALVTRAGTGDAAGFVRRGSLSVGQGSHADRRGSVGYAGHGERGVPAGARRAPAVVVLLGRPNGRALRGCAAGRTCGVRVLRADRTGAWGGTGP